MAEFWHGFANVALASAVVWVIVVWFFGFLAVGAVMIGLLWLGYLIALAQDAQRSHNRKY